MFVHVCGCIALAAHVCDRNLLADVLIKNCWLRMCKVAKWCLHTCIIAICCSHMIACKVVVHEANDYKLLFAHVNGCKLLYVHSCLQINVHTCGDEKIAVASVCGCIVLVAHVCNLILLAAPGQLRLLCTNVLIGSCCLRMCVAGCFGRYMKVLVDMSSANVLPSHSGSWATSEPLATVSGKSAASGEGGGSLPDPAA